MLAYHAQLTSDDDEIRTRAAKAWTRWECVCPQRGRVHFRTDISNLLECSLPSCSWTLHMSRRRRRTILRRESTTPTAHCARPARLTRSCSAFARIENHYFVNEVSSRACPFWATPHYACLPRDGCATASFSRSKRSTRCARHRIFSRFSRDLTDRSVVIYLASSSRDGMTLCAR